MTLIVGKIYENKIYIESDSKVTDKNSVKNDPLTSVIKTLILHPFISLSYAGNIHFAEKAIDEFFNKKIDSISDFLELLISINVESLHKTDFVVASLINNSPKFYRIKNGTVEKDLTSIWLGDLEAFNNYQKEYHSLSEDEANIPKNMETAFQKVIIDPNIKSVDHFQISLTTQEKIWQGNDIFLYREKVIVQTTLAQELNFKNGNEWVDISLGEDQTGAGHGLSYLITISPHFHGVAIHFTHGKFGVLFCPQINRIEGKIILNVSGEEFVEQIKTKYSVPLRGFVKTSDSELKYIETNL